MMPREHKLRPPTDGDFPLNVSSRSTGLRRVAHLPSAKTHRTTQDLVECRLADIPCGTATPAASRPNGLAH